MPEMSRKIHFDLDHAAPLLQQRNEPDRPYNAFINHYLKLKLGGRIIEQVAERIGFSPHTVKRYSIKYKWSERRKLIEAGEYAAELTARLYPPEPIQSGLIPFAKRYAGLICPGFELDEINTLMLEELELLIDGPFGGRLMMTPPPRHSKTLCSILAVVYAILRHADWGVILVSANQRLATANCHMMRTLFSEVCRNLYGDEFGLATDNSSKLAWSANWHGAKTVLATSVSGSILGYSSMLTIIDDPCSQISDIDSDNMEAVMRTITSDIPTRATKSIDGGGGNLCIIQQRLGATDVCGRLVARAKLAHQAGDDSTPWRVVASPAINPSRERAAEITGYFPDNWLVRQPTYGEEGLPVSHRFSARFINSLKVEMAPGDFEKLYLLNCDEDNTICAWRRDYIRKVDPEQAPVTGTFIAIDMNLTGGDRNDTSALAAVGVWEGHAVIVGLELLPDNVDEALAAIARYAQKYNAISVGVEKAASCFHILKSLNNRIGDRTFDVIPLSHEGRNKKARQAKILGLEANGKILAYQGLPMLDTLHIQERSIALDRKKDLLDTADACNYAIDFVNSRWIKAGWHPGKVVWGDATTAGGGHGTPVIWGRGSHAQLKPRVGIDGVERFRIPGFE